MDDYKPRPQKQDTRQDAPKSGTSLFSDFPTTHVALLTLAVIVLAMTWNVFRPGADATSSEVDLALELEQAPELPVEPQKKWTSYTVKYGDSIGKILNLVKADHSTREQILGDKLVKETFRRLQPKHKIQYILAQDGSLLELLYKPTIRESLLITRSADGIYTSDLEIKEYDRRVRYGEGTIESSLFLAGTSAGLSNATIMKLAGIFAWDIDFTLDIRGGEHFEVLYEELYLEGEKIKDGEILYASFAQADKKHEAFRHALSNGKTEYFSPDGRNLRKAFLRSPVEFARISSRFNLKRRHPILHKIRAHKGVDYAAARGTPIKAVGDGKVIFAGTKGGYGKVVILQHGTKYSTLYAHMHNYGRGIRRGKKVKQNQTIGYVGSSGMATGPHLHYEFRVNNIHKDPLKVKLPAAKPLPDSEKKAFELTASKLLKQKSLLKETHSITQASTQ